MPCVVLKYVFNCEQNFSFVIYRSGLSVTGLARVCCISVEVKFCTFRQQHDTGRVNTPYYAHVSLFYVNGRSCLQLKFSDVLLVLFQADFVMNLTHKYRFWLGHTSRCFLGTDFSTKNGGSNGTHLLDYTVSLINIVTAWEHEIS
jgi:hypothetical protein